METSELASRFREHYPGSAPVRVCRAPGRINLIGEHTDYNGLPVLPMAIAQDIRIAFAPRTDGVVRMRNVDSAFAEAQFKNAAAVAPSPTGSWENYCKAAVQALNKHFGAIGATGMDMLVSGTIPVASGLSSSSALVVACALAYLASMGKRLSSDITRLELAALLAEGEHYVGTQGGGMDQAIILLAEAGSACKIDFFPLRVERVPLPEGFAFVACDSLVKAPKTGEALHRYNAGPRTCRLIAAMVERQAQMEFDEEIEVARLGDLWLGHLCLTNGEAEDLIFRTFATETTTLVEAARFLGISPSEIRNKWLGDLPEPLEGFPLRARARHLVTEYRRVESARDALLLADATEFGRLMNASHESCAQDYCISCPELEDLVRTARDAGAWGARLTGAGFGGFTVCLVPNDRVDAFEEGVYRKYYEGRLPRARLGESEGILLAVASEGAAYIE